MHQKPTKYSYRVAELKEISALSYIIITKIFYKNIIFLNCTKLLLVWIFCIYLVNYLVGWKFIFDLKWSSREASVIGNDTLTPTDIRLSNIKQTTNACMEVITVHDNWFCLLKDQDIPPILIITITGKTLQQ